jgi:hypothetical protein
VCGYAEGGDEPHKNFAGDRMKVLVACEFSGIVRDAFKAKGHYAVSCDFSASEKPGHHIQSDVLRIIDWYKWDLMIAHPPCTHTAISGARWWKDKDPQLQRDAIDFFLALYNCDISKICIEHPVSIISTVFRKPDQYIQPWQFGHGVTKKTGLWLKNLPLLQPTNIVNGRYPVIHYELPGPNQKKNRSRTFKGIAQAMAEQWG